MSVNEQELVKSLREASGLIEAQAAEIERLRGVLGRIPRSVQPVETDAPLSFQLVALARIWWERKMKSQCRSVTLKGDGRVSVHWCDADECGHYTLPVDFVSEVLHPHPPATDVAALVEAAYREGWGDGMLAQGSGGSIDSTDDDDWADSDAFATLKDRADG